jgi:uncharacterized protein (DUF1800 family)
MPLPVLSPRVLSPRLALNRFGFGLSAQDAALLDGDGRRQCLESLARGDTGTYFDGFSSSIDFTNYLTAYQRKKPEEREALKQDYNKKIRETYVAEMRARLAIAADPQYAFRERMVWFWTNHFTVSTTRHPMELFAGAFEREAIRPFVNGRFGEMLIAVTRHPAMLLYLDNIRSIGPMSQVGQRGKRGLNENLAREILELHTLGVNGGYGQEDVAALARILTGWSLAETDVPQAAGGELNGGFGYYPNRHDPGAKQLLGVTYQEKDGFLEGAMALNDLALHVQTAKHLATKLAHHFISDTPSADIIADLSDTWLSSKGDLSAISAKLLQLRPATDPGLQKMRPPVEYIIACLRLVAGAKAPQVILSSEGALIGALQNLGEPLFGAPSPKGWSDADADWAGPEALMQRVAFAYGLAHKYPTIDNPETMAAQAFGPYLSDATRQSIHAAPSAVTGLALLLSSPEVQKR